MGSMVMPFLTVTLFFQAKNISSRLYQECWPLYFMGFAPYVFIYFNQLTICIHLLLLT